MLFFLYLRRLNRTLKVRQTFTITRNRVLGCFRHDRWFSCAAACVVLVIGVGCESIAPSKMESSESKDRPPPGEVIPVRPIEYFTDIEGKEGSLKILFLGDGQGNLPGVRREFLAVIMVLSPLMLQDYLHVNFLLGPNLTKQNLKNRIQMTRYSIVYYAGHTRANGHVLPFADSNIDTLEFLRIVNQNPPGLLFMNGCNTLGDPVKLDLMKALTKESGVVMAIGTSHFVEDNIPAEVFPQFFESLILRRKTIGDSLVDAKQKSHRGLPQYFILADPAMRLLR
jgi:hypothetical protein